MKKYFFYRTPTVMNVVPIYFGRIGLLGNAGRVQNAPNIYKSDWDRIYVGTKWSFNKNRGRLTLDIFLVVFVTWECDTCFNITIYYIILG